MRVLCLRSASAFLCGNSVAEQPMICIGRRRHGGVSGVLVFRLANNQAENWQRFSCNSDFIVVPMFMKPVLVSVLYYFMRHLQGHPLFYRCVSESIIKYTDFRLDGWRKIE